MRIAHSVSFAALSAVSIASAALFTSPACAQVVYDNGTNFNRFGGARNISSAAIADDFTLTTAQTFNSIRFYSVGVADTTTVVAGFSGTLSWTIYTSSGTPPNATPSSSIVASGSTSTVAITDTGLTYNNTYKIGQMDFSTGPVVLSAGTYWLRIKEGTSTSTADGSSIFWLEKNGVRTANGYRADSNVVTPTTWTNDGTNTITDMAFQLRGEVVVIPEPGSVALFISCLLAGAGITSRRKRIIS